MIKRRNADRAEVAEKRKEDGSSVNKNKKKKKFLKSSNKSDSNQEGKW